MSPSPSRAAASLGPSAASAAVRLDEARWRWLGGKRPAAAGVKAATVRLMALTARLNQCGKGSRSTNGKLGVEGR